MTKMQELSSGGKVSFSWDIHYVCNYRCPYCWFSGKWHNLVRQNKYIPTEKLIDAWTNVYKNYGSIRITIIGGEPFIYPNFKGLIKELSKIHFVDITSNLSVRVDDFIKEIDTSRVSIIGTFHPLFANFDNFSRNMSLLKESGAGNKVLYLAYPPQARLAKYYKIKFDKYGFLFSVMTFWGEYNGINYPQGYTQEERQMIEPCLGNREGEKFQLEPKPVKGKMCSAGQAYAIIKADGSVFRCGGSQPELLGNLFSGNLSLLDSPLPCKSEFCPCNEWAFLLKEK